MREYTQDLNFKVSAWDRLATETNVTGIISLSLFNKIKIYKFLTQIWFGECN